MPENTMIFEILLSIKTIFPYTVYFPTHNTPENEKIQWV